ncbi:MAG: hypothetical protein KDA42_06860 [Planctomycetales bacterium]|nr:hypothetical protein [Planctomycetales bacterium]
MPSAVALGSDDGVALAWVASPTGATTRVVRKTGAFPTSETDGTTVYEGTNTSFEETIGGGNYYYSFFATDGVDWATGTPAGSVATVRSPSGVAASFASNTDRLVGTTSMTDADQDGTLQLEEVGGKLSATLQGIATQSENDRLTIDLDSPISGLYHFETEITTPAAMNQTWNLQLELLDATSTGDITLAFNYRYLFARADGGAYQQAASQLQANTTYKIAVVVDNTNGTATVFVNEGKTLQLATANTELTQLRLTNMGDASADLTYKLDNIRVKAGAPSYDVSNLVATATALSGNGSVGAALAWTPSSTQPITRVVRKTGSYPADENDGTNVYQGTADSFFDSDGGPGLAAGTYYYSFFPSADGTSFSAGTNAGAEGTVVSVSGHASSLDPSSDQVVATLEYTDADGDGTLGASEASGALEVDLAGSATSGENDTLTVTLDSAATGLYTVEMNFTTPAVVNQDWSLQITLSDGAGTDRLIAFRFRNLFVRDGGVWKSVENLLTANTTYKLGVVVDNSTGETTYYLDEAKQLVVGSALASLSEVRLTNLGNATADLTYTLDDIRVIAGTPAYVVNDVVVTAAATGGHDGTNAGAALAWVPAPSNDTTRVVRKTGSYPTGPTDGTIVYEGTDSDFFDDDSGAGLAAGTYFYTFFTSDGGGGWNAGTNAGTAGTAVTVDGLTTAVASDSEKTIASLVLNDADQDGTLVTDEGSLLFTVKGAAKPGENDTLSATLDSAATGTFTTQLDITTPADIRNQDWNLQIGLDNGAGTELKIAFRFRFLLVWDVTNNRWQIVENQIQPNTTYTLSVGVNDVSGKTWVYLDGNFGRELDNVVTSVAKINFTNRGDATDDLDFEIANIRVREEALRIEIAAPPVNAVAMDAEGEAGLAWTASPLQATTRVIRKTGSYPTDENDGTNVFEGSATSYEDAVSAGTYFYGLVATDGYAAFSDVLEVGTTGTDVSTDGKAETIAADSERFVDSLSIKDTDGDASLSANETGGALQVSLAGAASNEELDSLDVTLDSTQTGTFTYEMDFTTPAVVNQDWNLRVRLLDGSSNELRLEFRFGYLFLQVGGALRLINSGMAANTTYKLSLVIDTSGGTVDSYIDDVLKRSGDATTLTGLSKLCFVNRGYNTLDVTYGIDDIRVTTGDVFNPPPPALASSVGAEVALGAAVASNAADETDGGSEEGQTRVGRAARRLLRRLDTESIDSATPRSRAIAALAALRGRHDRPEFTDAIDAAIEQLTRLRPR